MTRESKSKSVVAEARGPPGSGKTLVDSVSARYRRGTIRAAKGSSILRYFGFKDDPFAIGSVSSHPELVSDSTRRTLHNLAEKSGFASESGSNMLLVGPEGVGKSLLLHLLSETLDISMGSGFAEYVDAARTWGGQEVGEGSLGFRTWAGSIDFGTTRLLLVDNIDRLVDRVPQFLDLLAGMTKNPLTLVLGVNLPTYWYLVGNRNLSKTFPISMQVPQQEPREIEGWLKSSIRSSAGGSEPFDEIAYQTLASYSLGLPGLAANFTQDCLRVASNLGVTRLRRPLITRIADMLLYSQGVRIADGQIRLEGTKAEIAWEALRELYLRGEVRRGWIVEVFAENLARSTLSYHLRDLVEDQILIPARFGFRMHYKVARPVRAALQILQSRRTRAENTISIGPVPRTGTTRAKGGDG